VVKTISRDELKEKMNRGHDFVLIDTLAGLYYRHSHLPGAINVPADEVGERAQELLPGGEAEVVAYCTDPPRSASEKAALELAAMGYDNVRDYGGCKQGCKQDWLDHCLPAEASTTREGVAP